MKAARQITIAWLFALGILAPGLPSSTRAADGWHSAGQPAPAEDRSILRTGATARRESAGRLPAVSRVPVTAPASESRQNTAAKVSATMPVARHRSDPPPVEQTSSSPREGLDPVDDVFADVFGEEEAARMQQQTPVYQPQHQQPRQAQRPAGRPSPGQRAARGHQHSSRVMPAAYQGQSGPRTMPPSAFGPGGPVPNRPREVLPAPQPRSNYGPQPTPADGSGMEWIEGSSPGPYSDGPYSDGPYSDGYVDDGGMGCSSCGGGYDDGFGGDCCGDCGDCCEDCGPYACPPCDMCHDCYGGLLKYITVFGGPQAFKGPIDLGKNGNFGFHAGANFGGPVWFAKNIGGQIGAQWVGSDFSGTGVPYDSQGALLPNLGNGLNGYNPASRNQFFLTAGLFHRALPCTPWQFGAAFDYLDDRYYTNMSWSKVRGEVSFVGSAGDEIGAWASIGLKELTLKSGQSLPYDFQISDLYTVFYRKYFPRGGTARVWGGATNGGDGIVGGDVRMPISDWFALEANMNYIIPKSNTAEGPYNRESWAMMCNLVFYPGVNARCMTWSPWRPLFGVADNSTFILRRND